MHSTEKEDRGHWGGGGGGHHQKRGGQRRGRLKVHWLWSRLECYKCQTPPMTPTAVGRFVKSVWFPTWLALHTEVARYVRHLYTKKR